MKERATTIMIDTSHIPDKETAQETIRNTFQPWLDQLELDGLEYMNLVFHIEDGLDREHPNTMAITATVETYPKSKE